MYVIHLTNWHLPTFAVLYIKQSVRVANTETNWYLNITMPVNAVPMMITPTGEADTRSQVTENQLAKLCRKNCTEQI